MTTVVAAWSDWCKDVIETHIPALHKKLRDWRKRIIPKEEADEYIPEFSSITMTMLDMELISGAIAQSISMSFSKGKPLDPSATMKQICEYFDTEPLDLHYDKITRDALRHIDKTYREHMREFASLHCRRHSLDLDQYMNDVPFLYMTLDQDRLFSQTGAVSRDQHQEYLLLRRIQQKLNGSVVYVSPSRAKKEALQLEYRKYESKIHWLIISKEMLVLRELMATTEALMGDTQEKYAAKYDRCQTQLLTLRDSYARKVNQLLLQLEASPLLDVTTLIPIRKEIREEERKIGERVGDRCQEILTRYKNDIETGMESQAEYKQRLQSSQVELARVAKEQQLVLRGLMEEEVMLRERNKRMRSTEHILTAQLTAARKAIQETLTHHTSSFPTLKQVETALLASLAAEEQQHEEEEEGKYEEDEERKEHGLLVDMESGFFEQGLIGQILGYLNETVSVSRLNFFATQSAWRDKLRTSLDAIKGTQCHETNRFFQRLQTAGKDECGPIRRNFRDRMKAYILNLKKLKELMDELDAKLAKEVSQAKANVKNPKGNVRDDREEEEKRERMIPSSWLMDLLSRVEQSTHYSTEKKKKKKRKRWAEEDRLVSWNRVEELMLELNSKWLFDHPPRLPILNAGSSSSSSSSYSDADNPREGGGGGSDGREEEEEEDEMDSAAASFDH